MTDGAARLQQLLAVAMEGSDDKHRALLCEITDIFIAAPDRFAPAEMQHIDAILTRLASKADAPLRQDLSKKLAGAPTAPRGLMVQFARDEIAIAAPVLKRSRALADDDLLGVIRERGADHLRAISQRRELSKALTAELVAGGDSDVLINLAGNMGAKFSTRTMAKLVAHARTVKALQEPMTERFDVPAPLLTRLYFFVPAPLKNEILKRAGLLDPALIDDIINSNRRKLTEHPPENATPEQAEAYQLIRQEADAGEINEAFLITLLGSKRVTAFLTAFAFMAGIDIATAQIILKDRAGEALAIACRAARLERATFEKAFAAFHARACEETTTPRIFGLYEKIPQAAGERIMRFWILRSQSPGADDTAPARRRPKLHELGQRRTG